MQKYQMLYIIDIGVSDEDKAILVDKLTALITSLGGEVEAVDKWGVRRYAYPINDKREGYYVLTKFTAGENVPAELDRQMKINESVVRQLITKA